MTLTIEDLKKLLDSNKDNYFTIIQELEKKFLWCWRGYDRNRIGFWAARLNFQQFLGYAFKDRGPSEMYDLYWQFFRLKMDTMYENVDKDYVKSKKGIKTMDLSDMINLYSIMVRQEFATSNLEDVKAHIAAMDPFKQEMTLLYFADKIRKAIEKLEKTKKKKKPDIPMAAHWIWMELNPDTATEEMVQSSFRKKCMDLHPDRGGSNELMIQALGFRTKCLTDLLSK